ncbi:hypothetical protein SAMN04488028_11138 [Reichenbachiella agariperforans]|uniref:Phosphate-selective porin O and P n=1 Tax=Reichenbachiella agariperforans TaxID=156994 RepID=A0A1M6WC72_REIAG|nr:hypothetical protein [Reichenbachiella agariperforans]SHK91228.1 hypothetical protein SAMN04488028_11138 [Reichenbachiella agariperforans]
MKQTLLMMLLLVSVLSLVAQEDNVPEPNLRYGEKGWELSYGENYLMTLEWRLQFRFAGISGQQTDFYVQDEDNVNSTFALQRARLKVGGHVYQPYLKYYLEYDFPSNNLMNWVMTIDKYKGLQVKIGQWKINYNTERYVSSGKQQFVDRSIANRYFTFDRQIGAMIQGELFDGQIGSSMYHVGVFNGTGRGAVNESNDYLWLARYQWNFSRTQAKMSFGDLERSQVSKGFLAVSAATNQSAYTSFSSSGGGELPGFSPGLSRQYQINQLGVELMYKYKGFSLMNENHIKTIDDQVNGVQTDLYGGYLMAGYFLSELISFVPEPLELIARYSMVSYSDAWEEKTTELTLGCNWFFSGHRNKLTFDFSFLNNVDFNPNYDGLRARVQWDVSF